MTKVDFLPNRWISLVNKRLIKKAEHSQKMKIYYGTHFHNMELSLQSFIGGRDETLLTHLFYAAMHTRDNGNEASRESARCT